MIIKIEYLEVKHSIYWFVQINLKAIYQKDFEKENIIFYIIQMMKLIHIGVCHYLKINK